MSIRDRLNKNSSATTILAVGVIVLALAVVVWQFWPRGYRKDYKQAYYTNDEGKSWFVDDINRIPPFDKDGKPAYRAQVVQCSSGKPFVAFVMRFDEADKKVMEASAANREPGGAGEGGMESRMELRKPGAPDSEWGKWPTEKWQAAKEFKCPDGSRGAKPVLP